MSSTRGAGDRRRRWIGFLAAAWRAPREVGTLVPSGPALAERLACVIPEADRGSPGRVIVELGAGSGGVTDVLADRAGPGARLLAIERDPQLAAALRGRRPDVDVVTADAADLPAILAERGVDRADVIVSVLPWAVWPAAQQHDLLEVLVGVLHPDGVLTAAAYSSGYWNAGARRFRAELERYFEEVVATRTIWRHLPPAMSYIARRPRG